MGKFYIIFILIMTSFSMSSLAEQHKNKQLLIFHLDFNSVALRKDYVTTLKSADTSIARWNNRWLTETPRTILLIFGFPSTWSPFTQPSSNSDTDRYWSMNSVIVDNCTIISTPVNRCVYWHY